MIIAGALLLNDLSFSKLLLFGHRSTGTQAGTEENKSCQPVNYKTLTKFIYVFSLLHGMIHMLIQAKYPKSFRLRQKYDE